LLHGRQRVSLPVQFTDLTRNRQMICTLVYPHSLATTEDGVSVMAPIGVGLIGLRIDAILWQPEREGQFHR
jgi:regulator of nucleoside diphosphate kinase